MDTQKELEQLKEEILTELSSKKKEKKRLPWASNTVTVILVLLTIISLVQLSQSLSILSKIKSGAVKGASAASSTPLPSNLENLPNMVGGC